MLRIIHFGNTMPASLILHPAAVFQPGQIMEIDAFNGQIMANVSTGTAPFGVVDDIRTKAFTNVSINEAAISPATGVVSNGKLVTPIDLKVELAHPNILRDSFMSTVRVALNPINGIITFPAGTELNYDESGQGTPDSIRTIVNYTYQIPNVPGDDSTAGSGMVTIWYQRMMLQTDMFETNQNYPVRANLYVSEKGLFTTRKPSLIHPAIAMVTSPPGPMNKFLGVLWM